MLARGWRDLTLPHDLTNNPSQTIHLLVFRANQRARLIADDYLRCTATLLQRLKDRVSTSIHLPILSPERPGQLVPRGNGLVCAC